MMKRGIVTVVLFAVLTMGLAGVTRGNDEAGRTEFDSLAEKLKTATGPDRQKVIEELIESGKDCLLTVNAILLEEDEALRRRIAELVQQLGHEEWEKREDAHRQLVAIGLKALSQVTEGTTESDREIAYRCSQIKLTIEKRSAEEVVKRCRQMTALLFVAKALCDESSLKALHKCCTDSERDIRIAAADAVATVADPSSVEVLIRLLEDDNIHVHLLAGSGITRIKSDKARAKTLFMLLDAKENVYLRRLAAIALRKYNDRNAVEELLQVMDDRSYIVRFSTLKAVQALSGLKDETYGYDYQGDSDEAVAARETAIEKWKEWWRKEQEKPDDAGSD